MVPEFRIEENFPFFAAKLNRAIMIRILANDGIDADGKMLLERVAIPGNRRTYDVRLTRAGKRLTDKLTREYERVCKQILAGVSRQELEGLMRVLKGVEGPRG